MDTTFGSWKSLQQQHQQQQQRQQQPEGNSATVGQWANVKR
jgi:hypothetical protein